MPTATGAAPGSAAPKLGPLAAGTYTFSAMKPAVTITVPEGFSLRHVKEDEVRLTFGPELDDPEFVIATATEHNLVATLAKAGNFKSGTPIDVSVNGQNARAIDLEPASATTEQHVFGTTNSVYPLLPGWKARIIELDLDGRSFVIYFGAQAGEFAGFEQSAAPIVASLAF